LLDDASQRLPAGLDVIILPTIRIGASEEHRSFAGTLSVPTASLIGTITEIGAAVAKAGLKKLVLISSHGGNVAAMNAAALACRAQHGLLAVTTTWPRLGLPDGLVSDEERSFGIHGGLIETSLMLHFRPDLVDLSAAEIFESRQGQLAERHRLLRAYGPVGFGWLAEDLNPAGVVGDAARATADVGAAIARHQADEFLALLCEVADFDHATLGSDRA
jgi:creatinine amidohydrolase